MINLFGKGITMQQFGYMNWANKEISPDTLNEINKILNNGYPMRFLLVNISRWRSFENVKIGDALKQITTYDYHRGVHEKISINSCIPYVTYENFLNYCVDNPISIKRTVLSNISEGELIKYHELLVNDVLIKPDIITEKKLTFNYGYEFNKHTIIKLDKLNRYESLIIDVFTN